ncbi:MAG: hypothetical protein ABJH72_23710 [Reichenbachiella sp.]|uniref:hypothetical protein n=1 Tax=Reichenbachiella sp. TaxID=2184521 RepID=UPI0032967C92
MNGIFLDLRDDEIDLMYRTPALIALLVAGADGKIDSREMRCAAKFVSEAQDFWTPYFHEVAERMPIIMEGSRKEATEDLDLTMTRITVSLRQLNSVLPKLARQDAIKFYDFLLRLSKEVAGASGGIFGFNKISKEEELIINLPMIDNPAYFQPC